MKRALALALATSFSWSASAQPKEAEARPGEPAAEQAPAQTPATPPTVESRAKPEDVVGEHSAALRAYQKALEAHQLVIDLARPEIAATSPCPKCGGAAEFDDLPETYLVFTRPG